MNVSILGAIFYCVAFVSAYIEILLYKKTDRTVPLLGWLPATFLLLTCYQCLVAAVINIIHIPITTWTLGIGMGILAIVIMLRVHDKKNIQKYEWNLWDILFVVCLLGVMAYITYRHYGWTNLWINYSGIDASQHWKSAMEVYSNHEISGMFYDKLFNGMLFQVFLNWIPLDYSYRVFVLGDLIDFALAATMFYGLLREMAKKAYENVIAILLALMFVLGYQLDAIFEGFVYLGMGVTLVTLILFLLQYYEMNLLSSKMTLVLLNLALLGLILCYSLYVPIVYVVVCAFVWRQQKNGKKIISGDTVAKCLKVFAVPCIVGFYYSFLGVFGENLSVGTQISTEGGIYKDLFSNFIFVMILALIGLYQVFHHKKNLGLGYMMLGNTLFIVALFIGGMLGKISAYYFYKMYFLEWMLCFETAYIALTQGENRGEKVYSGIILGVWVAVLVNGVFNTGAWIQANRPLYDVNVKSPALAEVYVDNLTTIKQPAYSLDKQDLYHHAYDMMTKQKVGFIGIACYWHDSYWYQAFTNLRWEGWDFQEDNNYFTTLQEKNPTYLVVLKDCDLYENNVEYFDNAERVYENQIGYIIRYDEKALQEYLDR